MKNRKHLLWLICIFLLFALPGCQLAQEDAGAWGQPPDRMIGVLITTEHLGLFCFTGDMRLYAQHISETTVDAETGQRYSRNEFVFPGVEGMQFFVVTLI